MTVGKLPAVAVNSANTAFPLAINAYTIVIAARPCLGYLVPNLNDLKRKCKLYGTYVRQQDSRQRSHVPVSGMYHVS